MTLADTDTTQQAAAVPIQPEGAKGTTADAPALLLVSEMYPPALGGSAVLFENIYGRLNDIEVDALVDTEKCAGNEPRRGDVTLHRMEINKSRRGLAKLADLRQHWRLGRKIRSLTKGRNVIAHCGRPMPEGGAALASRMFGGRLPYYCWAHGEDVSTAMISREYRLVMTTVLRRARGVICNSHHTASLLTPLGLSSDRIHVIHPAVDPTRFRPDIDGSQVRQRYVTGDEIMLLTVGRMHRRKGQDMTIKAVARLKQERPELPIQYVIVGGGDERADLERLVQECQVQDRVTFAGEVSNDELPAFFAACDVFLMPNRIDGADLEGFGIVYLEAAATEKPAIGGTTGGVPESVAKDETGLLVRGDDPDELAEAIRRLAESSDLRRQFGDEGRRRVLRNFTWDRAVGQMRKLHMNDMRSA